MRQISRYESPSRKRKRKRRMIFLSVLILLGLFVLAPFVGNWLRLPYDLNVLHFFKNAFASLAAPFVTPTVSTSNTPKIITPEPSPSEDTDTVAETLTPETIVEKRQKYSIDITIDNDWSRFDGKVLIEYTNPSNQALDKIALRFSGGNQSSADPALNNRIDISRVIADGQSCSYSFDPADPSVLWLQLPKPLEKDGSTRLTFAYTCEIAENSEDFGRGERSLRLSNFYPVAVGYGANGWLIEKPNALPIPYYQPKADFSVVMRLAGDYFLSATSAGTETAAGTWTFEAQNVRDFAIALGGDRRIATIENDDYSITANSVRTAKVNRMTAHTDEIITYYSALLGSFSGRLELFEAAVTGSSSTHDGLILLDMTDDDGYWTTSSTYSLSLAIARLWFGVDISGDAKVAALNELISHYLAVRSTVSIHGEEYSETVQAINPNAQDFALILNRINTQVLSDALMKYRLSSSGYYADVNMFLENLDADIASEILREIEAYQSSIS